jgi:hypothetical protein
MGMRDLDQDVHVVVDAAQGSAWNSRTRPSALAMAMRDPSG